MKAFFIHEQEAVKEVTAKKTGKQYQIVDGILIGDNGKIAEHSMFGQVAQLVAECKGTWLCEVTASLTGKPKIEPVQFIDDEVVNLYDVIAKLKKV